MKGRGKGFTIIELAVALAIITLVSGAAAVATFQVFHGSGRNNDHMTAVREVQNAGYWISRDAQMAQSVTADNLTPPDFLILNWTEWDEAGEPIYHSVTYSFIDLTDGIGKLKRSHWSSAGANEQTLVAEYIYYNPADPDNTSKASYQSPLLTVRLTSLFAGVKETREYRIIRRPTL
jgi:prepilin-type N-terminal cleavage/methylation domain-containing protein